MSFLQRLSTVVAPARMRAGSWGPLDDRWYMPGPWVSILSASGMTVTPDLAMTLSAMYSGVTMIAYDLATLPCQVFALREDGGKDRLRPFFGEGIDTSGGIRSLAYMLRWQPNAYQTATEYFVSLTAQYLLRGVAYAEIVSGPRGFVEQLLPRHPDRVTPEMLPSGRLRYKVREGTATPRYLTQDEMFVIRDLSMDGLTSLSRVQYGAQAIGTILAAEKAAGKFFKSGMTSSVVATYKSGPMDPDDEANLHASISRYATGAENNFGLLLIPDDVSVANLGIEPEKAQMMLAREWGVREIARLLRIPGHKLGIKDSVSYNSQIQGALEYVINCLRPTAITFEQAIQRDLILRKDTFFAEFKLEALLRGDFESQANYLEKFIRNRVMRPSEARLILNMNPDPALDRLSESDFRPGQSAAARDASPSDKRTSDWSQMKGFLAIHDQAVRCLRRERATVERLARKHASDVEGWRASLRDFYAEHAGFVAQTMRLPIATARGYAAQHGSLLEAKGIIACDEYWEREEAEALSALALQDVAA